MRRATWVRFRQRGFPLLKFVAFSLLCWWLILFGFKQDSKSEFGENLERNQIEISMKLSDTELSEKTEFTIVKNDIVPQVDNVALQTLMIEENVGLFSDPQFGKMSPTEPQSQLEPEVSWQFSKPPNIFNYENVGELGVAVKMPQNLTPEVQKLFDDGWKTHQFNQYLSDLISVQRKLPDFRSDYCKNMEANYSKNLPATSVIIIFHNEAWTTLLRSVHSVLDRSPEHLITEIILVDDFSDLDHLKRPLEDYMAKLKKVKIVRAASREGLIKARLRGADAAKGPVLTFLDSHIECTPGWLEPLLDRIAEDPRNVVVPIIEVIDDNTFEISNFNVKDYMHVGGFSWNLNFKWDAISDREKQRKSDPWAPTRSPAMAGGLFAMDKAYFETLGRYDPGMDIWGSENVEISIRIWTCGGVMEIIPCSKVGHIFRKKSPYTWRTGVNVARNNAVRLVEVWLDDYKKFFYAKTGKIVENYGDVSDRIELRKQLGCKSFQWFLDNVYPELKPSNDLAAFGEIRSLGYGATNCLDAHEGLEQPVKVYQCHNQGGHQYWEFEKGHLKRDLFSMQHDGSKLRLTQDNNLRREQLWEYNNNTKQLYNNFTGLCLTMSSEFKVRLRNCTSDDEGQKWQLENLNLNNLRSYDFI